MTVELCLALLLVHVPNHTDVRSGAVHIWEPVEGEVHVYGMHGQEENLFVLQHSGGHLGIQEYWEHARTVYKAGEELTVENQETDDSWRLVVVEPGTEGPLEDSVLYGYGLARQVGPFKAISPWAPSYVTSQTDPARCGAWLVSEDDVRVLADPVQSVEDAMASEELPGRVLFGKELASLDSPGQHGTLLRSEAASRGCDLAIITERTFEGLPTGYRLRVEFGRLDVHE